ncbi:MAG: hypothetical protein LUC97_10195 [Clostridiales bacterium]|nr:hypothetical protein [Clostridiales bacterium]
MKKKLSVLFTIFFAAVFSVSALAAEETTVVMTVDSNVMTINGEGQELEQSPVIIDGRTLVPVRAVVEAIGGEADWNSETREITITKGTDVISMTINSETAYLNGEETILDTAPVIINSRTCMPIRFIAESLGFEVSWNENVRQIIITGIEETEEADETTIIMQIDNPTAAINGVETEIEPGEDVSPVISDGRTLVPLRFLAESLGFEVEWDAEIQQITITKGADSKVLEEDEISEAETTEEDDENMININISIGDREFEAVLYDNETAKAFAEKLPVTYDMSELNGNEKYFYMEDSLPADDIDPEMINTGDIMLYDSNYLTIFYDTFVPSYYSYTPMGYIVSPDGLSEAVGSGDVTVTITK